MSNPFDNTISMTDSMSDLRNPTSAVSVLRSAHDVSWQRYDGQSVGMDSRAAGCCRAVDSRVCTEGLPGRARKGIHLLAGAHLRGTDSWSTSCSSDDLPLKLPNLGGVPSARALLAN